MELEKLLVRRRKVIVKILELEEKMGSHFRGSAEVLVGRVDQGWERDFLMKKREFLKLMNEGCSIVYALKLCNIDKNRVTAEYATLCAEPEVKKAMEDYHVRDKKKRFGFCR